MRIVMLLDEPNEEVTCCFPVSLSSIVRKIPGHKIRIAGRSVPFEKFAIERHDRFLRKGHLFLPAVVSHWPLAYCSLH